MKKLFNKMMNLSMIASIIFICLGVFLYVMPYISATIIGVILGSLILLMGVYSIYKHKKNTSKLLVFQFELILGVISLLLGILIILNPLLVSIIITVCLGIWLLILGTFKINYALSLKKFKEDFWPLTLTMGIIYLVLGAILIFNPLSASMIISEIVGLFVIVYGLISLVETHLYKQNASKVIKVKRRN